MFAFTLLSLLPLKDIDIHGGFCYQFCKGDNFSFMYTYPIPKIGPCQLQLHGKNFLPWKQIKVDTKGQNVLNRVVSSASVSESLNAEVSDILDWIVLKYCYYSKLKLDHFPAVAPWTEVKVTVTASCIDLVSLCTIVIDCFVNVVVC